ncbi:RNA polymerase sigma factor [Bacillus horti]|uniref:RNA polymerase sigma-70 factor (ECF subfamily) n=1 Tax=Caldalkalibacillus horti TaxID=77523 RepID=A0ABT9VY33_9BACI|nr:RNA polymerase sigma factor [Bacillus horti]MDQ0165888.1 RNA polymerase sigma-70 factor (ECF subfamily) [Bacillus horti]
MNWDLIWREYHQEIYMYVYYRVYNKQEAEDITQEAFLKVIRASKRYEDRDTKGMIALLKTTARNLVVDSWRKQNTSAKHVYVELDMLDLTEQERIEDLVEQKDEIRRALQLLNHEQRKIVKYRLLQGFSIAETAKLMGKSISAIKTTQHRSIQFLRGVLNQQKPQQTNRVSAEQAV